MDILFALANNELMKRLDPLRMFIEVVRQGSFTGAGKSLGCSKSFVSEQISLLEQDLGTQLLRRTTRSLSLTEAGESIFNEALESITRLEHLEIRIKNRGSEISGKLRVTAPNDLTVEVLASCLPEFQKRFPKIELEVLVTDRILDHVKDKVDIAIRVGNIQDSTLIQKKIADVRLSLFASPDYLETLGQTFNTPLDIQPYGVSFFRKVPELIFYKGGMSQKLIPKYKIYLDNVAALRSLCLSAGGFVVLPQFVCKKLVDKGELKLILPDWSPKTSSFYFLYDKAQLKSERLKVFVDFVTPILKNALEVSR